MSGFKGVFLDLDNTLYDYLLAHTPAKRAAAQKLAGLTGQEIERCLEMYDTCRKKFNTELKGTAASHNRLLYFKHACEQTGLNPVAHALDLHHLYWDVYIKNIIVFDGVLEFLRVHQDKKIVILTDMTADIQIQKVRDIGIGELVTHLVTSEEIGAEKPDAAIFNAALEKCRLSPEEVCMVGDNFKKDIVGAQNMGIKSFWLNRDGEAREYNGTVTEIAEFKELLELI